MCLFVSCCLFHDCLTGCLSVLTLFLIVSVCDRFFRPLSHMHAQDVHRHSLQSSHISFANQGQADCPIVEFYQEHTPSPLLSGMANRFQAHDDKAASLFARKNSNDSDSDDDDDSSRPKARPMPVSSLWSAKTPPPPPPAPGGSVSAPPPPAASAAAAQAPPPPKPAPAQQEEEPPAGPKACDDYRVDMTAARFGDCKCKGGPQEDDRPGTGGRRRAEDVRAAGNSTASAKASTCAGSDTRFSSARSSSARAPNTSRADARGTHLSSFAVVSQDAATSTSSSWRVGLCATAARSIAAAAPPPPAPPPPKPAPAQQEEEPPAGPKACDDYRVDMAAARFETASAVFRRRTTRRRPAWHRREAAP